MGVITIKKQIKPLGENHRHHLSLYQLTLFNSMAKEQISNSGFIYVLFRIVLANVAVSPKMANSKNQWSNHRPPPKSFISHLPEV